MARSAAALFASGATVVALSLVMPGRDSAAASRVGPIVVVEYAVALAVWALGGRFPEWTFHLLTVLGAGLVTAVVMLADGDFTSAGYASLYVVVSLYAFFFFARGIAIAHLMLIALASMLALAAASGDAWWTFWLMLLGTSAITGLLVGTLVERVRSMARADMLTGLANRRAWEESLPREVARAARAARPVSVAVIDLDHFKNINDTMGHQAGDQTLRTVAAAWSEALRESDVLARYGGDEFALVMPECDAEQANEIVARLRTACADGTSFSAGIATWNGRETISELVRRADEALYRAKDTGRDRTVVSTGRPR
jgi:diguanylate cyclase (GGDEF)-like protein